MNDFGWSCDKKCRICVTAVQAHSTVAGIVPTSSLPEYGPLHHYRNMAHSTVAGISKTKKAAFWLPRADVDYVIWYVMLRRGYSDKAPAPTNTPASGSQQAAQLSPKGRVHYASWVPRQQIQQINNVSQTVLPAGGATINHWSDFSIFSTCLGDRFFVFLRNLFV